MEAFRTRLLNITLSIHPIFFSSQNSNQIKEKRLQAALAQNLYTFPSLEKEGVLSWQDNHCTTVTSLCQCFSSVIFLGVLPLFPEQQKKKENGTTVAMPTTNQQQV